MAVHAEFATTEGSFTVRLFDQEAPDTVANFVGLAEGTKEWTHPGTRKKMTNTPFYDGIIFHRVINGFMIQGGDPLGQGIGGPGYEFVNETRPDLTFDKPGLLAMANAGPDTNGSQFFITEDKREQLNGGYTIFGHCKEIDLVKKIAAVPRDGNDKPNTPVVMTKVTIGRAK